ncbi:hypothetical protein Tco_1255536 [Tanacetum coccineum]
MVEQEKQQIPITQGIPLTTDEPQALCRTMIMQEFPGSMRNGQRNGSTGSHQKKGGVTSYVSVVNGVTPLVQPGNSLSSAPALVLDEECVVERDSLMCYGGVSSHLNTIYQVKCYYGSRKKEVFTWTPSYESIKGTGLKKPVEGEFRNESVSVTPRVLAVGSLNSSDKELNKEFSPTISAKVMNNSQVVHEDVSFNSVGGSGNNKGGSILGVLDEMIRVGRAMGYSMEGCEKDIESIINSKGDESVLR